MHDQPIRERLVQIALEWEARFGVAPAVTCAISELDAALLVGCDERAFAGQRRARTAVTAGFDFEHGGRRYQVKANRPSGKPGSTVTLVGKAKPDGWDRLVWILYDPAYRIVEAWEWERAAYVDAFQARERVRPADMRRGACLYRAAGVAR